MEDNEELLKKLTAVEKKLDKLLTLNTKIAKKLHLLPVTEREERDFQVQQRKNFEISEKVNDDLNALDPSRKELPTSTTMSSVLESFGNESLLFGDVIANDFLGGGE